MSIVLIFLAFIFFLIGVARAGRTFERPSSTKAGIPAVSVERLRIIRRADWRCAASLLYAALVAYALTLVGTGPLFTEASGNVAGGVLLIAGIVGLILVALHLVRHIGL